MVVAGTVRAQLVYGEPAGYWVFVFSATAIITVVTLAYSVWSYSRRTAWWISARLSARRPTVRVRTTWYTGAWNPANRGAFYRVENRTPPGRGLATYTLTSEGMVSVEVVTSRGERKVLTGPLVARAPRLNRTRARRTVALAGSIVVSIWMLGALVGYAIDRATGAAVGFILSLAAVPFLRSLARLTFGRNRKVKHSQSTSK